MTFAVCGKMEAVYQKPAWETLAAIYPTDIHFPFRVHLINAFGYREDWSPGHKNFLVSGK